MSDLPRLLNFLLKEHIPFAESRQRAVEAVVRLMFLYCRGGLLYLIPGVLDKSVEWLMVVVSREAISVSVRVAACHLVVAAGGVFLIFYLVFREILFFSSFCFPYSILDYRPFSVFSVVIEPTSTSFVCTARESSVYELSRNRLDDVVLSLINMSRPRSHPPPAAARLLRLVTRSNHFLVFFCYRFSFSHNFEFLDTLFFALILLFVQLWFELIGL